MENKIILTPDKLFKKAEKIGYSQALKDVKERIKNLYIEKEDYFNLSIYSQIMNILKELEKK